MVKKIRVWKVLLLSIVTLGLYEIVWLARRRNEIVESSKLYVPHWLWIVLPIVSMFALVIPLALIAYGTGNSFEGSAIALMGFFFILTFVVFVISLWWIWHFGRAIGKITQGRFTLGWTLVYWFFMGPLLPVVQQYYLNRTPKSVNVKAKKKFKPSKKFIILSLFLLLLGAASCVASFAMGMQDFESMQIENKALDAKFEKMERLTEKHTDCVDALEVNYPNEELTDEEYEAFNKDYNECEKLRLQQNAAVDAYEAAYEIY